MGEFIQTHYFMCILLLPVHTHTHTLTLTSLHVSLLESRVQHLITPILLGEVLQGAAIRLHLLIQAAAVDEHRGAALGVPASLTEHLLQLFYSVAALPLADAMLLYTAVAAPQGLCVYI